MRVLNAVANGSPFFNKIENMKLEDPTISIRKKQSIVQKAVNDPFTKIGAKEKIKGVFRKKDINNPEFLKKIKGANRNFKGKIILNFKCLKHQN